MAKTAKALVKKELLIWARTSAGFQTVEEAAAAAGKLSPAKLTKWESGETLPSVPQLRKLAAAYKRPLAVFYLDEVPQGFMALRDLRRLPGVEMRRMSPSLLLEIRRAAQRRALALELLEEIGEKTAAFQLAAQLGDDPDAVAVRVRDALRITIDIQQEWSDFRTSWNNWRMAVESLGVLVFQATRIESQEASGFAIADDVVPVIVVNRRDPVTRRTFSLLHEFVHLMVRISSVSDLSDRFLDDPRPPEDQAIEIFCNAVAAAVLMPRANFLAHPLLRRYPGVSTNWSDDHIAVLAQLYGVSREAVVRRLLTLGRTTSDFYIEKRNQYIDEYRQRRAEELQKAKRNMKRNMPRETVSTLGTPLVNLILSNYHSERLSISEVSGYLDVKTKHIPKIEEIVKIR